jgi:hypothetical protein
MMRLVSQGVIGAPAADTVRLVAQKPNGNDGGETPSPCVEEVRSSSSLSSSSSASLSSVFRFKSDGIIAFCENLGASDEKWSVPIDNKQDDPALLRLKNEPEPAHANTDGGGAPFDTLECALRVAHAAVQKCQRVVSRLDRPKDSKTVKRSEKETAREHQLKEAQRQKDRKQAKALAATVEQKLGRLREANGRLTARLSPSSEEARLRGQASVRERALQGQLRDLETEKMRVEALLRESEMLVENNRLAGLKQQADLKQARRDLADFEVMKARVMELETSFRNHTEVADLRAKMEANLARQRRLMLSERARSEATLARVRKESDARVACLEASFEALRVEFIDRVGEMPETRVLEPRDARSDEDDA